MFHSDDRVDPDDPLPRHAQVQRLLRLMTENGRLRPGDKIPAEIEIAESLGVSKMTVNKALLALAAEGLFVREVGRGTFVADDAHRARSGGGIATLLPSPPAPRDGALHIALSFPAGAHNVLSSDYYGTIYRGIAAVVEQAVADGDADIHLDLAPLSAADYVAEDRRCAVPPDGRIIIAPRARIVPSIERAWQTGRPIVVVGASWPGIGVPAVDADNAGGAEEAVRHLIQLGHERIALIFAEGETSNTQERIVGYRRALAAAHLPHDPSWEIWGDENWRAGNWARERLQSLVSEPRRPVTAVFAAGHYLALEAMSLLRDIGKSLPSDVSVIGFDDPLAAQLVSPSLTTVRQPLFDMGRRAATRMLSLLYGRGEPDRATQRELLPATLIVRRSTAPAPPLLPTKE